MREKSYKKLFTIITPTYNCEQLISDTIKSVINQQSDLFEYIIVDGGSTDKTLNIINKYKNEYNIKMISEKDRGIYDAMNKGISMSKGKYLLFLGAGDKLKENILYNIYFKIKNENDILFLYGNVYMKKRNRIYNKKYNKFKFCINNICQQSIFYDKRIFDIIGLFDIKYKYFSDYIFNIKCFSNNLIKKLYINYIVTDYLGGGISENCIDEQFNKDYIKLIRNEFGYKYYLFLSIKANIKKLIKIILKI